jgi:hypothetical protein
MAISQKHRSTIYQQLSPIIGEEEAEALLSHFPARDLDEPVTKEFVRVQIADVRVEIADVRVEIADVRAEMRVEFATVRSELAGLRAEMHDRFRAQTIWIASAMAVGMGLAAGIGRL